MKLASTKVLGISNKQVDAYKDISLINHAFVFYAIAESTKPRPSLGLLNSSFILKSLLLD